MYSFKTNAEFSSKRYPGVKCTIQALTVKLRSQLDMAISEDPGRDDYYNAIIDREDIQGEDKKSRFKRARLNEKITAMEKAQSIGPTLRLCLASIEGLQIDGEPATVETLIAKAPDDLCQELMDFINFDMRLSVTEQKVFTPPSGSSEPAAGTTPNTTAPDASETAGTEPATADSSLVTA